jgi:hypothetical protein
MVVGVIGVVLYFFFTANPKSAPGRGLRVASFIGKWTMILAFGAVFASTVSARLSLLIGRAQFLMGDWLGLIK